MRLSALLLLALTLLPATPVAPVAPAAAQERETLGVGRLFSNDFLGDREDRWRTGSWSLSLVRGPAWTGEVPGWEAGLLEYRFRVEILAPTALYGEGSDDRPYAGALTFGLHRHFAALGGEVSAGADFTATGPSTGVMDAMDRFHTWVSAPNPSDAVRDGQVADGLHPSATLEYARPLRLSPTVTLRPFAGGEAGVEDLGRIGMDVIWGAVGQQDLWIRDVPSGQLYRGVEGPAGGLALVAGADWSAVGDSLWLPDDAVAEDERLRARAGVHWQIAPRMSAFYGLSWLSPEMTTQDEGQVTGQLKLNLNF